MAIPAVDADALRYAGWMGHTVVVLVGADRSAALQTNDVARAKEFARERGDQSPAIYKRAAKGWKQVRP